MNDLGTLDDATLHRLAALIRKHSGIHLETHNRDLVRSRIAPRLRKLGIRNYREYIDLVQRGGPKDELAWLLDAISTNLTRFMREEQHFKELQDRVISRCVAGGPDRKKSLRLWSAACSSGEEAYSIAVTIAETLESWVGYDIKILATDLSRKVLATASTGVYKAGQVEGLTPNILAKYFDPVRHEGALGYQVRSELSRMITFARLNLIEEWPMRKGFDAIFCRNVMIYFEEETRAQIVKRMAPLLNPGGILFVGHSETIDGYSPLLEKIASATYQKRATPGDRLRDPADAPVSRADAAKPALAKRRAI